MVERIPSWQQHCYQKWTRALLILSDSMRCFFKENNDFCWKILLYFEKKSSTWDFWPNSSNLWLKVENQFELTHQNKKQLLSTLIVGKSRKPSLNASPEWHKNFVRILIRSYLAFKSKFLPWVKKYELKKLTKDGSQYSNWKTW